MESLKFQKEDSFSHDVGRIVQQLYTVLNLNRSVFQGTMSRGKKVVSAAMSSDKCETNSLQVRAF